MKYLYRSTYLVAVFSLVITGMLYSSEIEVREAFPNLTFNRPVDLQHAPDGTDRIFVVTLAGRIYVFDNDQDVTDADMFLDISDRVVDGGERGLLGLAFHPEFENNGYFYVNYTSPDIGADNPTKTVISRFEVDDNNGGDEASETILLEFNQPYNNHNGGQIAFGPDDGYLYIASGDGGSGGDPDNNAQNPTNLLGAILRIDVDNTQDGLPYAIPDGNPFVNNNDGYREEIYAYGLRNPWRMSFDDETGWLWCADVGQNGWEIIHLIEDGLNYGWNIIEGSHCYPPGSECDTTGLEMPLYEYEWIGGGSAITGGYVYRGSDFPELYSSYIYADYGFGTIWALSYDGEDDPVNQELIDTDYRISSFGVDTNGEIYFFDYGTTGRIYTFDTATSVENEGEVPNDFTLQQNYPNPFNNETVITFTLPQESNVTIEVYNLVGQKVGVLTDRHYESGRHTIEWNAAGLGSGVYFYRMEAGSFVETKRMVLLQ